MDGYYKWKIETPIGEMLAIADADSVVSFLFKKQISNDLILNLPQRKNSVIEFLHYEIDLYFSHKLKIFESKCKLEGTEFQKKSWRVLQEIPYGSVLSYKKQAELVGRPTAMRAVGNANACNKILILVPCHRVLSLSGRLSGFNAGVEHKKWLLNHESAIN